MLEDVPGELTAKARRGGHDAFSRLVEAELPKLRRIVRRGG